MKILLAISAAITALWLVGCSTATVTSPNTIWSPDVANLPSGYGVNRPQPKHAGVFVKTHGRLNYFDEAGFLRDVHVDAQPERTFYVAWDSGQSWFIFLNPDGTFPSVKDGRRRNLTEASTVIRASRNIAADQIDACLDEARKKNGNRPVTLTGAFEVDDGRIYRGPRLPLEVTAPVRVGPAGSGRLVCAFNVVDGNPVLSGAEVSPP